MLVNNNKKKATIENSLNGVLIIKVWLRLFTKDINFNYEYQNIFDQFRDNIDFSFVNGLNDELTIHH